MFRTLKEASLPINQSYDALRGHLRTALMKAHNVTETWDKGPWVDTIFASDVVYTFEGKSWRRGYKVKQGAAGTDPEITLGAEPKEVHVAYADTKESEKAERVILSEGPGSVMITPSLNKDDMVTEGCTLEISAKEAKRLGTDKGMSLVPVKIIGPGWGSMAYYPKEVLKRDGPQVFKKGTHMMWNHATATEESERPEGDLSNLAAVLIKDAEWKDDGPKGPGLYSEAKVFSEYATQVAEKGDHIGVSINAYVTGHEGEMEGKTGKIADKFVYAYSADFVTKAGAGGAPIVPVQESNREQLRKENTMTEQEIKALQDQNAALLKEKDNLVKENATLKTTNAEMEAQQNRVLAMATVGATLREADIPYSQKLLERACVNPTMKEGKLDQDWVKSVVADFSEGETGRVSNMGHVHESEADKKKATLEDRKKVFKDLGVPEAGLEIALGGR